MHSKNENTPLKIDHSFVLRRTFITQPPKIAKPANQLALEL